MSPPPGLVDNLPTIGGDRVGLATLDAPEWMLTGLGLRELSITPLAVETLRALA